jgi:transketolase
MEYVNGGDRFGQTGTPSELMNNYGLSAEGIVAAVKRVLARK